MEFETQLKQDYAAYCTKCEEQKRQPLPYESWMPIMVRSGHSNTPSTPERPFIVRESLPYAPAIMDMLEQPAHDIYFRGMGCSWSGRTDEAVKYSAEEVLEVIATLQARNSSAKLRIVNTERRGQIGRLYRQTVEDEDAKGTARGDAKHKARVAVLSAFGEEF
ncbi:hypothetical protein F6X40_09505 [Paraburkholderia sp. UCT31]|uniref:hypothetical protein n=1 Tax=Paraburkholderia sp. UCT31 TaxID=2615209 RepID=UPI001655CAAF|nr:hypothetical protein [Paraburkholderia sp. UCT31]MBC8737044.1 hypothetical protein [Paraburkholderia sp. UCT31]